MRRRWVKVLTIVVVVLAVLGIAADRLANHLAEQEAAKLAEQKYGWGQDSTNGYVHVAIDGFPFLTQALGGQLDHVTLSAGDFSVGTSSHAAGDYLNVQRLTLDLHGLRVPSLTARSAQVDLVTGDLTFSYQDLSGVVTRLMGQGGALTVGPAPGSNEQEAKIRISGPWAGRQLDVVASLLAQRGQMEIEVPGMQTSGYDWSIPLPENVDFTAATSTPTGVDLQVTGHQVVLGSSIYGG
jgi:hypothetical protein